MGWNITNTYNVPEQERKELNLFVCTIMTLSGPQHEVILLNEGDYRWATLNEPEKKDIQYILEWHNKMLAEHHWKLKNDTEQLRTGQNAVVD